MTTNEGAASPKANPSKSAPEGPLGSLSQALPDLAARLHRAGLPVTPDRWQNLYDLLLVLAAQGRLPVDAAGLEPFMAPLFCRSSSDQRQFREVVSAWAAMLASTDPEDRLREAREAAPPPPPPARLGRWWLALALLLAASVAGLHWHSTRDRPEPLAESPAEPTPAEKPVPGPDSNDTAPSPPEQTTESSQVQPRTPPPVAVLDPYHRDQLQFLSYLWLLVPLFVALAWLLLGLVTWSTVLKRRRGDGSDPLVGIRLDPGVDDLLDAPDLHESLKRLHMPVRLPTRRLDARATVDRTARRAGLFQPVRRQRRTVPELVVLVETRDVGDQVAGLAGQLVDRLRTAGPTVHRFDYRDDPRRVVGKDGRWCPLSEIAARHAEARLLIIGESLPLMEPFAGRLQSWTTVMNPWQSRALLMTRSPPPAWEQALKDAGFALAEVSSAGFQMLILRLGQLRPVGDMLPDTSAPPLPRLIQETGQWSQPVPLPGDTQAALLKALEAYLRPDGIALLTALAAYPQLHWGLTRVLDLSLFPRKNALARERRLLRLLRLPWLRSGWLPDWLREALLDRLDRRGRRRLRLLYRRLLHEETVLGDCTSALPVSLPEQCGLLTGLWHWLSRRRWRLSRWFRALRALSPDHGVFNDAIFADVLFSWRPRWLDFTVARRLLRRHVSGALGQALAPRLLIAAILGLGGAWLADWAWQQWMRGHLAEPWLMQRQQQVHGKYRVRIWHRAEVETLARALRDTLRTEGFAVAMESERLAIPEGSKAPQAWQNQVQAAEKRMDQKMAEHIADRLRYLTWGNEPERIRRPEIWAHLAALDKPPAAGELRILLTTPGNTLSGLTPSLTEIAAEMTKLQRIRREDRTDAQRARFDDLRRALRDADERYAATLEQILAGFAAITDPQIARVEDLTEKQLRVDLRRIVAELSEQYGRNVALINYLVAPERLHILLTLPEIRIARQVEVTAPELNREIEALRHALSDPRSEPTATAQILYQRLIAPIAADLRDAQVEVLMLNLDGALWYVPFAALHDGAHYLVEDYALSLYTSAAGTYLRDRPDPALRIAAFGSSHAFPGFAALPGVAHELEAIVKTSDDDPDGVLQGKIYLDKAFTEEALRDGLKEGYPIVHIASPYVFQRGTASDPFLLLGDGTHVNLYGYRFTSVDLLTLSYSETALGAEGREIEGFATLAMRQGAKAVLSTLWSVPDRSTALFMTEFYRQLSEPGLSKAEALRRTQRAFVAGASTTGPRATRGIPLVGSDSDPRGGGRASTDYGHPYYWAPFVLMGNWL